MNQYWNNRSTNKEQYKAKSSAKRRSARYKPQATGGIMGWGMNYGDFSRAKTGDLAGRAKFFMNPLNAATREDALNTMGMLSKAQKSAVSSGGFLQKAFHMAIPGATAFGMAATMADGGDGFDYMAQVAAPEIGLLGGWRAGKAVGQTAGSLVSNNSKKGLAFRAAAGVTGGIAGALTGALALGAVAEGIHSAGDSNNFIKKSAHEIRSTDLVSDFVVNQNTLTHRRKALQQLSKSSLNNRGQLMGNEAMIMRGIM